MKRSFSDFDSAIEAARHSVPNTVYRTLTAGVGRGLTAEANVRELDALDVMPRPAIGHAAPSTAVKLLDENLTMPVILAPVGGLRMIHPDGAPAVAEAAHAAGVVACASMVCGHDPAAIGAASQRHFWQQLYLSRGRDHAEKTIAAAAAAGAGALVVTVDCATAPQDADYTLEFSLRNAVRFGPEVLRRPRWFRSFLADRRALDAVNEALTPTQTVFHATWEDFAWIRKAWSGPMVVKGVLRASDAERALDVGADALVVSNHGGFSLDGMPGTASRLRTVTGAVAGRVPVLFDGGVRSGLDVARAVALGADTVLVGRYYAAALAAAGGAGVRRMLDLLHRDLIRTLTLLGCPDVVDLDERYLAQPINLRATATDISIEVESHDH